MAKKKKKRKNKGGLKGSRQQKMRLILMHVKNKGILWKIQELGTIIS